jgi:hypothetical protein
VGARGSDDAHQFLYNFIEATSIGSPLYSEKEMRFNLLEDELHSCNPVSLLSCQSNNILSDDANFKFNLDFSVRAMISICHPSTLIHSLAKLIH